MGEFVFAMRSISVSTGLLMVAPGFELIQWFCFVFRHLIDDLKLLRYDDKSKVT